MAMSRRIIACLLTVFLALTAGQALAAGGGGGGGGGHGGGGGGNGGGGGGGRGGAGNGGNKGNPDMPERTLDWQDSLDTALEFASHGPRPIMAVLARNGNDADRKLVKLMTEWPVIDDMSKTDLAFVWQLDTTDRGKELIAQFKVKTFPYVVWLDQYGNALFGQSFPDSASAIQAVVQGWKLTLDNVSKFMHDRVVHADKLLAKGKLREAYQEYSLIAPFKGPDPDKARAGKDKVLETWKKLLALAGDMPPTAHDRTSLIAGLQKEIAGLDCAKIIAGQIAALNQPRPSAATAEVNTAAAAPAVEVAANTAPPPAAAPAAGPPLVVASAQPPAEVKPLKQLASAPIAMERESDESSFDTRLLSDSTDDRLKNADKLLKQGLAAYRQACADSMDRGEPRNALLKKAHDLFDSSVQAIDTVNAARPNAQLDNMMSQISMLMYGCLKYQTL